MLLRAVVGMTLRNRIWLLMVVNIHVTHHSAIPIPRETNRETTETCTQMLVVVLFVSPRWEPSQTCTHGDGKLPTDVGAATEVQSQAGEKRDIQCS